jgi:hypothetical protein
MLNLLLPALFLLAQAPTPVPPTTQVTQEAPPAPAGQEAPAAAAETKPAAKPEPAKPAAKAQDLKPLSFFSQEFKFRWDQFLPLGAEVDGLKVNSIFFNKRTISLLKGAEFGTRAVVDVTNTSSATRTPGFAVAVFDAENRLLGVASGGPKIGGVAAGTTESFTLSFGNVTERIPRADHFVLAVELTN